MPLQWWTLSCVGVWKAVNRGSTSGQRLRASHTTETHTCPHTFGSEAKLLKGDFVKNHQRNTCQVHRKEEVPLHGWVGNEVFLFSSSLHLRDSLLTHRTPRLPPAFGLPLSLLGHNATFTSTPHSEQLSSISVLSTCWHRVLAPGLSCKMWLNEQRPRWAA